MNVNTKAVRLVVILLIVFNCYSGGTAAAPGTVRRMFTV